MDALIKVFVSPKAKKTAVKGLHGDAIKIQVAAPPIKGRANKELIAFIAKKLGVKKELVSIKSGRSSKNKTIKVKTIQTEEAISKLLGTQ